jgi:hypothetical protein
MHSALYCQLELFQNTSHSNKVVHVLKPHFTMFLQMKRHNIEWRNVDSIWKTNLIINVPSSLRLSIRRPWLRILGHLKTSSIANYTFDIKWLGPGTPTSSRERWLLSLSIDSHRQTWFTGATKRPAFSRGILNGLFMDASLAVTAALRGESPSILLRFPQPVIIVTCTSTLW